MLQENLIDLANTIQKKQTEEQTARYSMYIR